MAQVVRERWEDTVFQDRWTPTLIKGSDMLREFQFMQILEQKKTNAAVPVLEELIDAFLSHQQLGISVHDELTNDEG